MKEFKSYSNKNIREYYEKIPLRDLPHFLSKVEKKIYECKKAKISSDSNRMTKLRSKRNILRKVLLNKLIQWEKNPNNNPEITYSEILEIEEKKRLRENYEKQA